MNINTHPVAEDLIAYLENPQAEVFTDICLHLAQCRACRIQTKSLSSLEKIIKRDGVELVANDNEKTQALDAALEASQIESYLDGELQGEIKKSISAMIDADPHALKAALHYASHSSAMKRELKVENVVADSRDLKIKQVVTFFGGMMRWFKQVVNGFNPSSWLAIPVTAVATALVVVNLVPLLVAPGNSVVASYQDNPIVQFRDKNQLPGIGFFNKSANIIKPYNNVQVTIMDTNSINLQWSKIEEAISYTLRLQLIDNGQKVIVAEQSTTDTSLTFSGVDTKVNHRYEWVLSGKTRTEQTFYTSGGFVINHTGS